MNAKEFYDYITTQMTAEEALMKLLEGHVMNYEKLKFQEGEEIHPLMLISLAAMDMGWNIAISDKGSDDDDVVGMVLGTEEYVDDMLTEDDNPPDHPDKEEN